MDRIQIDKKKQIYRQIDSRMNICYYPRIPRPSMLSKKTRCNGSLSIFIFFLSFIHFLHVQYCCVQTFPRYISAQILVILYSSSYTFLFLSSAFFYNFVEAQQKSYHFYHVNVTSIHTFLVFFLSKYFILKIVNTLSKICTKHPILKVIVNIIDV